MKKFGNILNSRPAGREAVLRMKQIINGSEEDIALNFEGVDLLTPSFADEFIRGLKETYSTKKIEYQDLDKNEVIRDTLKAIGAIE